MSDSKETNTPTPVKEQTLASKKKVSIKNTKPSQTEQEERRSKSSGSGLSVFALLLSLSALIASGFTWYQTQVNQVQSNSKIAIGVTEIGGNLSRLSDVINLVKSRQEDIVSKQDLSNELRVANQQYDTKLAPVISQQQVLETSMRQISADLKQGESQYVLNEVTQLLKLANHNVHFSKNVESTVMALKLADGQLKDLSDPRYAVVRSKINEEVMALKALELVDIEALSAQLNGLSALVPGLLLANEPVRLAIKTDSTVDVNIGTEQTTWRSELHEIWSDILSSIQVQRVDQPPKPLLVPEQRYFLNQNIQLSLSKADLALLQGSQTIYQQSLSSATTWLIDYFDTNNAQVDLVIQQLTDLQAKRVTNELPDVTGSFDMLQSIKAR